MKIAVSIDEPEKSSPISEIFGRCNSFLIYDREKKSIEFLTNPFSTEIGGAGIHTAKFLIEKNVDAVIVKNIGENPFRFLTSADIKIFLCKENTALDAIRLFNDEKLTAAEIKDENLFPRRRRKRRNRGNAGNKFFNNKKRDL